MAFNLEDALPKDWIKTVTHDPNGATVITYRNPNADPVEREKNLLELGQIMLPAYYRMLEAKEKEAREKEEMEKNTAAV